MDNNREMDPAGNREVPGTILKASHVYLLLGKEHRISRNRRAEWFFTHLNSTVSITPKQKLDEYTEELEVVSVIPKDAPHTWSIGASHLFRYLICSDTNVEILSRKYRFVYCLDFSPSTGTIDVQKGIVTIDAIFGALQTIMEGLVKPFYVPGSYFLFQPKIYVTVLAHAPFLSTFVDEAILQGVLLDAATCKHILRLIFRKLEEVENRVAKLTAMVNEVYANNSKILASPTPNVTSNSDESMPSTLAMSPEFALVDLLRHALIALHLLPENSGSGLIVLTDGVISVPDGGYLDMMLSQLRYNMVSCSFIQLSSSFHPHASHGALPYSDLMRFISTATFGAFLTNLPRIEMDSQAMSIYHKSFLTWSFNNSIDGFKNSLSAAVGNKPGEWSVQNKCFSVIRDMPVMKKQQYETTMSVDYLKVLACRLREGFTIKEAQIGKDDMLHIKLVLPWKFLIVIEYMLITPWPAIVLPQSQAKVTSIVSLEGPYDFLHDVTCLAKKSFQSYYRQLLVNKYWASQKHLSESDKLLAHLNSFSSNSHYHNIPERLKNGVPLFQISTNSTTLSFQSSEIAFPHFSQFWKPVCLLDTDIWQKWMHTHRIGVILEHDHPIPKYIHQPNPSGRYHVIQCRQTMMGLNTLLMDWSSFVLVENHSYVKLMFKEKDKPPYSFCIIRVTTKPPCVILRLAFLVGTPGDVRHRDISELCQKIAGLTFPQRLNEPPKWRVPSGSSLQANPSRNYKRTWSDMPCCVILYKPIEKILIRYEQIPGNFFKSLLPQDSHTNWALLNTSRKAKGNQSTFGFRPTYATPLGSPISMGPEMFNTVARYLHHKRWIWSIQGTASHLPSMESVVRILSTITKMRLQEGMRFGYTCCGIINMIMELELQNERLGISEPDVENIEDYERTTSILQYVMFPPVTSLFSNTDAEDQEREEDLAESYEDNTNLYLITECWVEPQAGHILSNAECTSFNGLEYFQVPAKIHDMDRECISALVTFEHLSLMSQNDDVPSPSEIIDRGIDSPGETEDKIQYIPFKCELNRILPKCQQAELLFSMFNQDLSLSFPVFYNSEISAFCDRANSILFDSWISNVTQLHQREVTLHSEEHLILYDLITSRVRPLDCGERPFPPRMPQSSGSCPKWRSFIKGLSPTHFLLTVIPASYHDLKLLMLSQETLEKGNENKSVSLLSSEEPNDTSYMNEHIFAPHPAMSFPGETLQVAEDENEIRDHLDTKLSTPSQSKDFEQVVNSTPTLGIRKRSRVKSGGESGPVSKKPLNHKTSLDNLFRHHSTSVEGFWKSKTNKGVAQDTKDSDNMSILSPKTPSERQESEFLFENRASSNIPPKLFPSNHEPKFGSITLPIYVYDCSLPALSEHIIFRTTSGVDDIYSDCRVCSITDESGSYPPKRHGSLFRESVPVQHSSPEPKSDDQDLPPTNVHTLEHHCQALEVAFAKSYVHGLFESLQAGDYIHKKDVQEAVRLCRETKIEINLSEFIQTICRHFKEARKQPKSDDDGQAQACDELREIHAFVKRRFNQSILSSFHWVMDYSGIFYFKNSDSVKLNEVQSKGNSSKNLTDAEENGTMKVDSSLPEGETTNAGMTSVENEDIDQDYPILGPDFFTADEGVEVLHEDNEPVPLFLYLSCTYTHGDFTGSFLVSDIPTCLEEIAEALGDSFEEGDVQEKLELSLEFVFLTVPTEVEEVDYRVAGTIRTSSMCSLSPIPMGRKGELNLLPFSKERDNSLPGDFDHGGKVYPILPSHQYHQVKSVVDDVKWLLKDEITSFRRESSPMTELALMLVACHVEKSPGKPGCQITIVPLNFVNNSSQVGFEKFKERFRKSSIEGNILKEEGSLFYLVPIQTATATDQEPIGLMESGNASYEERLKVSSESLQQQCTRADFELDDLELVEISACRDQHQRKVRKSSGQESERNRVVTASLADVGETKRDVQERCSYLPTPSQLSEISSIVESINTNEDGYEGDGSDSAEDLRLETSIRGWNLTPFWIICKVSQQDVVIYFHCRHDENNLALFEYLIKLRNQTVHLVRKLKRIVNQDILLQQLHDTRQCSNLIEPKPLSPDYIEQGLQYPPVVNKRIQDFEEENENEPKQFPFGYFACDVVWETKFVLHSRLRTGPGKSLVSRGIQTLQGNLIAFEVANRRNMFVYQDQAGNVFYLRLYRMGEKALDLSIQDMEHAGRVERKDGGIETDAGAESVYRDPSKSTSETPPPEKNEGVVLLRVHGITEAGDEIKENLVQSLRNKLDDAVMDILSVTLDRNPHCKLTPEDVTFIQKINSPPDAVLQNGINTYALQHLPAFAYFLHQNLLQFFHLPKYTESKPEFQFQDIYDRGGDGNQCGTMYLYNQRPGGTGSRGIAAVAVSIVDADGTSISTVDWSRPTSDAYLADFGIQDFEERISTEELPEIGGQLYSSVWVEIRMWKQGRINMDLLKRNLSLAIKHSLWDLMTEFYFLTVPLSAGVEPNLGVENGTFSFSFSVPNTPTRVRSGPDGKMAQGRASSPMAFPFPGQLMSKGRQLFDPLVVGLSRTETGDVGCLHRNYENLFPAWCEFGAKLNVPSVRIANIDLATRHSVDTIALETEKLIQQLLPDYEPKQFWKLEHTVECEGNYSAGEKIVADSRLLAKKNMEAELKVFKTNLRHLSTLNGETVLKDHYPQEYIPLFSTAEEFDPQGDGDECILISRNLVHWKFCVGFIHSQYFTLDAYKSQYKFAPLISSGWMDHTPVGSYMSLEKLPRPTSATGLACLLSEPENNTNPILVPRQRFLLARVNNSRIYYMFYNWSKETSDRLIDSTKLLVSWLDARSYVLHSVQAQKSGIFYNQSITRGLSGGSFESNRFTCGGAEVESLVRCRNPSKEFSNTRSTSMKPKSLRNLTPFLESFRNLKHQATTFKLPILALDPLEIVEEQMTQMRSSEKTESKNSIFQYWLSRGPSASNVIGPDGIQKFKQAARALHYCFTPIIFLPRWRSEIACTRDNSIGIVKKRRTLSYPNPTPLGYHHKADLAGLRSRHDSGTSQKSLDSAGPVNVKGRSRSIWGLWHNAPSQLSQDSQASSSGNRSLSNLSSCVGVGRKSDEKWHASLCDSFIQEYMQYLQTLGFIPIQGRNTVAIKLPQGAGKQDATESERLRHTSGTSMLSSSSSQSGHSLGVTFNNFARRVREDSGGGDEKLFYLQKSLPGGIILFEVGLVEPFFYAKMHTLELTRIQSKKSRKGSTNQNILDFVGQCERMKVLMHLHSFTYDFHLRSIHSYILGRQLFFKQGYHITSFLDDFVKYYPKGPNFARNTVYIGMLTIQNVTTPATILFSYMLEKLYNMKVIRMNVERSYENNHCVQQFILVDISSKKILYKDVDDERQFDEFDLTLLIAHDSPPFLMPYSSDPSVLRLKYYIILTSRRELYPRMSDDIGDGKLCFVNTTNTSARKQSQKVGMTGAANYVQTRASVAGFASHVDSFGDSNASANTVIREESAHYMGFFSSHEQMMQQIICEQVVWVEERIRNLVTSASVDCRRELLWQRLVLANYEKRKNQKEDLISRETVGPLSYWEFGELLELVHIKSLSKMDVRLGFLLRQPRSFYQSLLKLITQGGLHNFRYFACQDNSIHHLAIFSPKSDNISLKVTKHIVMLDINLERRNADLSILFKEHQEAQNGNNSPELEPEMLTLVESVVNTVCYCWWWWSTIRPG